MTKKFDKNLRTNIIRAKNVSFAKIQNKIVKNTEIC